MGTYLKVIVLKIDHFCSTIEDERNVDNEEDVEKIKKMYNHEDEVCLVVHM